MRVHRRSGFTLVELVVAAFIFAVGALALEAMAASSLRRMRRSADLTLAAAVARSRLEILGASRCADLAGGSDTARSIVSSWAIAAAPSQSLRLVSQTITYQIDGAERVDRYQTTIRCGQ